MSYVSKREKVFDLPEQEGTSASSLKNAEARLKCFPSVSDRRAWTTEEQQRYQHLYGLVSGSETNVTKSSSGFKYIPFDVLLSILMAEKDAYIQELLDRQEDKSGSEKKLYEAEGFEDSDDDRDALIRKDAQMLSLKNKISGLESELEDYRETLTKAMYKLENMDAIIKKNNLLQEKLKCAEESIKLLEKQKSALENELWNIKRNSESDSEIDDERGSCLKNFIWEKGDCNDINRLASERDILKSQVEDLQKELERAKADAAEINNLRKISETTSNTLGEVTKENVHLKKKLEAMKCLEKYIEDLKQEAYNLTDKYKRESEKANDQLKRNNMNAKELQALKEERDKLQKRIDELIPFESQYISLQSKLYEIEIIIDENEILNKKLSELEEENERLKIKINQFEEVEIKAAGDKEKIFQLQCEVMDQEEEIQRMLRQIEDLSDGYTNKNELHQLKKELEEKNGKLKHFERQVIQIPILESEIEELKNKLQKCIDNFKTDKNLLERLQDELEACKNRCQELEELASPYHFKNNANKYESSPTTFQHFSNQVLEAKNDESKGINTDFIRMQDAASQSPVIQFDEQCIETLVNDIDVELRISKDRNESLQKEVEFLTSKLLEINSDNYLRQTNEMKELLNVKEEKIIQLEAEIAWLKKEIKNLEEVNHKKLKKDREVLELEIVNLNEINEKLMEEIEIRHKAAERANELETVLSVEKKARNFALNLIKDLELQLQNEKNIKEIEVVARKLRKEEANVAKQEFYQYLSSEISVYEVFKALSTKVINELKVENKILREFKEYSEKVEVFALKGLIKNLRAKVKDLKNLLKSEHEADYKSIQEKVRLLLMETNNLVNEINNLKVALDAEKKTKDFLEKELMNLQDEVAACLTAKNKVFNEELEARDVYILELKKELAKTHQEINDSVKKMESVKEENINLLNDCNTLRSEQKYLKCEVDRLTSQLEEQNSLKNEINHLSEQIEEQKKIKADFSQFPVKENEKVAENFECSQLICAIKEHENLEKDVCILTAQIQDQKKKLIDMENRENEYINEITTLKKHLEERETDLSKVNVLEEKFEEEIIQEFKNDLLKHEEREEHEAEKVNEVITCSQNQVVVEEKEEKEEENVNIALFQTNEPNDLTKFEITDLKKKYSSEEHCMVEDKYALEKAMKKLENEFDEFILKLNESNKTEEEIAILKSKRTSLLQNLAALEKEIQLFKNKLNGFDDSKNHSEKLKEKIENSENVSDLILKLEEKQLEVEDIKAENENLKKELSKAEGILEISKKLHKTVSQIQTLPASAEFFTPPAFPSPRSTDCLELEQDTVPLEIHRKELIDIENRFNAEIKKLKKAHSTKIKKLSSFHEKDTECRIKIFNDTINSTKSNYENDIRKLVEKHKKSIAKLLEFHENDLKELNRKFEIQIITLEKQNNDLMEDMRLKSLGKCKLLEEQNNEEAQEIPVKHEGKQKEKEVQTQAELNNLELNMSLKTEDLQEVNKRTVDNLTQFYQKSILEMKEKHDKEIKKCKKSHVKTVELMKNNYEDLLIKERKKYEEQLEEMLHQLKKGQPEMELNEENSKEIVQRKVAASNSNPSLEFIEVLQKILHSGLESLTFQELILVHSKTCFIPEIICDHEERGDGALNEFVANGCRHKKLMTAEREKLLKRIFTLERESFIKQFETHGANKEAANEFKIQELKKALSAAQQKNIELKKHLTHQSKFQMDMKIEKYMMDRQAWHNESDVVEKVKEIEREKAEKKRLEEELQREKTNVKNLSTLLESEKERFRSQRKKDLEYVEFMRFKLEETLKHEQIMESQLDNEARFRVELESELQSLQKSFNLIADGVSAPPVSESKTDKDFRNFDQCESKKVEKVGFRNRSRSRHKSASKVLLNL